LRSPVIALQIDPFKQQGVPGIAFFDFEPKIEKQASHIDIKIKIGKNFVFT